MIDKKDNDDFDFDDNDDFDFSDEGLAFKHIVTVNMQADYIEMSHEFSTGTLTLVYNGISEEIYLRHNYTASELDTLYPHLDNRTICSIASVFKDLRYFGFDFYSGSFAERLEEWLEDYVFFYPRNRNHAMDQHLIERETTSLFRDLSRTRLHKCGETEKFTPLIWASTEQIKELYERKCCK